MKKLILASAALFAAASISAQEVVEAQAQTTETPVSTSKKFKPGSERFGAEAGLSLGNGFSLSGGNLNVNYTLSDELMLRLGFGLTVNKSVESDIVNSVEFNGHKTETAFDIKPGIVYSFTGTDRLEPYVGAELLFGINSTCNYADANVEQEAKSRSPRFGANAITGFNFYVAQDLYVGAEVGFGFVVSPKAHTFGTDEQGNEYDSKESDAKGHTTVISANVNPAVRVGWKF